MRVTIERANRQEMRQGYRWRVKVFDTPDPECLEIWEEFTLYATLPEAKAYAREKRKYAHFHNRRAAEINATYFADENDGLSIDCGGTGTRTCYCGGDNCVCGNNGEAECMGCPDCFEESEDFDPAEGFEESVTEDLP